MIRVDALRPCIASRKWPFAESAHLFTDDGNLEELHEFAKKIGLYRIWFQLVPPELPHYDITKNMWTKAHQAGAVPATRECVVEVMRRNRERNSPK